MQVDLNCDMGEGFGPYAMGDDEAMLGIVTSANVACGWHAGDPNIMAQTARMAKLKGVAIGAHPGFADLWGFGRRVVGGNSMADIEHMVAYQIGALQALAALAGHRVTFVKAHGALNNMANEDDDLGLAVARGIRGVDRNLVHVCMPGLAMERGSHRAGLQVAREVFADRTYNDDGTLTNRKTPGAVIHDVEEAARRTLAMVRERAVTTVSGRRIPVEIDTVCVHGDTPDAVAMARRIREVLEAEGVTIAPFAPPGN
jgi:UPF0271 protein